MSLQLETGRGLAALPAVERSEAARYRRRRWLVFALNLATCAGLVALMAAILGSGGWTWAEPLMLLGFAVTLP